MSQGDQPLLVEPVDPLFRWTRYFDFAVAICSWLARELNAELKEQLNGAQIILTKIEYIGAYPSLSIKYNDNVSDATPDLDLIVEATIKRLMHETSIIELVNFIASDGIDWHEVTTKLMKNKQV